MSDSAPRPQPTQVPQEPSSTPEATKRCPFCGEEILTIAIRCKHCGSDLSSNMPATSARAMRGKSAPSGNISVPASPPSRPWYYHPVTIAILFCTPIWPLGILLMWIGKTFGIGSRINITVGMILLMAYFYHYFGK